MINNQKRTKVRFSIAILMTLAIAINYLDRTVMSAAAPTLSEELQISPEAMGWIMSAFFLSYALCQIPAGFIADRFGQRRTLAGAVLWWSMATAATALAKTPFSFISTRILMGMGEAGAYPCNSGITAKWFPDRERGRITALFDSGSKFGTAFAMPLVVWIIAKWGWESAFIFCGALGFLWVIAWLKIYHDPEQHPKVSEAELKYIRDGQIKKEGIDNIQPMKWYELFRYRNVQAMCMGFFLLDYAIYFFITWFPAYLMMERGMSLEEMGFAAMLPPLCGIAGQWLGGFTTDYLFIKYNNINIARKVPIVGGMLVATSIAFSGLVESTSVMMFLLCLSYAALAFAASAIWSLPGDVAPRNMTSVLGGMQSAVSNCGGILGPIVTGYIIGATGSFMWALIVSGIACAVGALIYLVMLRDIKPITANEIEVQDNNIN
ncbi:TPA: MFS transporter [Proteus mirabilis]|uniref:MFS transporter n=1 Tax=Proteus mirabilis TaxID=584 RepID=UPI000B1DC824|nr:MFS transporter [Proteus mirabilis]AZH00262.1 MFS transporter [Proteus mirabilis]MBG6040885.1 MFS transporter [Proteus mirabilis]MBS3852403.1 MFS transporter [Proteus mirabilis]MCI9768015.1 MFS transporter [Proteus mirabilis]MCI9771605.1 MFS transporter [Proteus mirabilis]